MSEFPWRIVYTENGKPAGDWAENKRRNESLRMNQELYKQYPVYIEAKEGTIK